MSDPEKVTLDTERIATEVTSARTAPERGAGGSTSSSLREIQQTERHLSRAAWRTARAIEQGFASYLRARDESAGRRKDGALVELPGNLAAGVETMLEEASRVPRDLARAAENRTARRAVRAGARLLLLPFRW